MVNTAQNENPEGNEEATGGAMLPVALQADAAEIRRVRNLRRTLRPDDPIGLAAQSVCEGAFISTKVVDQMIGLLAPPSVQLGSQKAAKRRRFGRFSFTPEHIDRELAAWTLGQVHLTDEQLSFAKKALRNQLKPNIVRERRERRKACRRGFGLCYLIWACLPFVWMSCFLFREFLDTLPHPDLFSSCLGFLYLLMFIGIAALFGSILSSPLIVPLSLYEYQRSRDQLRAVLATALGRQPDLDSLDLLAATAVDHSPQVARAAVVALASVLPLITEDHYGRLASETTPILCRLLTGHVVREELGEQGTILILEALGKAGDGRAVEPVERIANWKRAPVGFSGSYVSIRDTAQRILPVLEERKRQEENKGMLLRGSQASQTAETLLRAAGWTDTASAKEQLLRTPGSD